jgi:hypothetical protein
VLLIAGAQLFGKAKPPVQEPDEEFPQPGPGSVYWPIVLALQAGYILAIYLLGFSLATLLYLVIAPLQLRYRRWAVVAVQAALLTVIISGSFIWFFHIRLPKGIVWTLW